MIGTRLRHLAFGCTVMAVASLRPAVSYLAIDAGLDAARVGLLASAFASVALVVAIPMGRAIDRQGEHGSFVASMLITATASIGVLVSTTWVALLLVQIGLGIGHLLNQLSMQSYTARNAAGDPDREFAVMGLYASTGQLLGPLVTGLILGKAQEAAGRAYGHLFGGMGLLVLSWAVVEVVRSQVRRDSESQGGLSVRPARDRVALNSGRELFRAVAVSSIVMSVVDLLVVFLPLVGVERSWSPLFVGALLSIRAVSGLASRLLFGLMFDRLGRNRMLIWASGLSAACLFLLAVTDRRTHAVVLIAVIGLCAGVGMPLTTAWVSSIVSTERISQALAVRLTGNRLAQLLIPAALGSAGARFGAASVFVVAGAVVGVAGFLVGRQGNGR